MLIQPRLYLYYFVRSPRSSTPTEPTAFLHIDCRITACDHRESIGFRSLLLTGLYRFTLSHCGSRTPLPTLKPHLTAPASRLCTGCLLGFTGFGISPNCIICTELAHLYILIIAQMAVYCNGIWFAKGLQIDFFGTVWYNCNQQRIEIFINHITR